jgi:hypothetical protein
VKKNVLFGIINLLGCLWLLGSFLEYNVKICDLDYKLLSVIFQSSVLWYMFWLLIMPKSWFHIQPKRFMNPSTILTNCYFLDIEIFIRIIYTCFLLSFFFSLQPLTIYHATQAILGSSTPEIRDKLYIHYLGMLPSIVNSASSKI